LHSLFPDLRADLQIPVIAGDYVLIEWWATAMAEMAQTLARVRPLLAQTPPPDMNGDAFKKVQAELWEKMSVVGKNTHDRFAEPWGLLAMDLASGQRSHADVQITSPRLALLLERS